MTEGCDLAVRHKAAMEVYVNCLLDTKSETWMAPITLHHFEDDRRTDILPYKCIIRKFQRTPIDCRKCHETIEKKHIVIGVPLKDVRGPFGYITQWHHLECGLPIIHLLCGIGDVVKSQEDASETQMVESSGECGESPNATGAQKEESNQESPSTKNETNCDAEGTANEEKADPLEGILRQHVFGFDKLNTLKRNVISAIRGYVKDGGGGNGNGNGINGNDGNDGEPVQLLDANEIKVTNPKVEKLTQPPELLTPLLPFQIDGLTWMYHQEKSPVKGGILADEMGMGKTIQTIALLLARKRDVTGSQKAISCGKKQEDMMVPEKVVEDMAITSQEENRVKYKPEVPPEKKSKKGGKKEAGNSSMLNRKGGTLIVSPLAALLQWYNEIKTKTMEGSLSVLLYHGPHRKHLSKVLHEYDVVITTYSIVEAEFRKVQNKNKVACQYCGRIFLHKTFILHQKYFCGPNAKRTEKQRLSERKSESTSAMILKAHARLFPDIKKVVDEINCSNESALDDNAKKLRRLDDDDDIDFNIDYEHKILRIEIVDAFILFGFKERHIEDALSCMKDGVMAFLARLKSDESAKVVANIDKFEMLERFSASDTLDIGLFKTTTVVQLKELIGCLGLGAFGCKAELINKVIVFINKMRRFSQCLNVTQQGVLAVSKVAVKEEEGNDTNSIKRPSGKRLKRGGVNVKTETSATEVPQQPDRKENMGDLTTTQIVPVNVEAKGVGGNRYKHLKSAVKPEPGEKSKKATGVIQVVGEKIYEGSVLHELIWERIVIDEAHRIKTKSNSTSQAVIALRSSGARWCLTGTPLQNRVGDVFSLISFLKMFPYAFTMCNKDGCVCESTELSCQDYKYCDICGHSRISHYSYFNRHILNPILKYGYQNEGQAAMQSLHNDVFSRIMLRRTKLEKAKDVNLPPMHVTIRRDTLSDFERDFYEALYMQSTIKFDTYAKAGTLLHNYAHIFDLLTRLRQAVDHPYLILYGPSSLAMKALSTTNPNVKAELEAAVKETLPALGSEPTCGICFEVLTDEVGYLTSNCRHDFHQECLDGYLESRPSDVLGDDNDGVTCPTCYAPLTIKMSRTPRLSTEGDTQDSDTQGTSKHGILQHIKVSEFKSSTKIEALFSEISDILTKTTDKCLVFSQYCSMLELIAFRLKSASIRCAILVGSTSLAARRNMLLEFNNNPNLRVLLISLKAGGEGLNLQIANRIFLMDPWWNPASELQAIQRAHRIGQTKPVYAIRFICKDTIEERIIELQEKKMIVFDATICSSASSMAKLSSEDLSFLFKR